VQVLLFTVESAPEVKAYLSSSRWARHMVADTPSAPTSGVPLPLVRLVTSESVATGSAGDALRTLDERGLLRQAIFLLLEGPVVGSLDLASAIAAHEAREALAPEKVTITSVVRPTPTTAAQTTGPKHLAAATRAGVGAGPLADATLLSIDPATGRLWGFDVVPAASYAAAAPAAPPSASSPAAAAAPAASAAAAPAAPTAIRGMAEVPKDVAARLVTRADLAWTGVHVCSAQVGVHFTDNYDYTQLTTHYIHHEVGNYVMDWMFHVHVAKDGYAVCPSDPRGLAAATAAVVDGWASPLTPTGAWATAASAPAPEWRTPAPGVSVHAGATVDPTAVLRPGTVVAAGATVGAGAVLSGTVVGTGAAVGAGARVTGSVLFAGAVVGKDARVTGAILADKCSVGDGAVVSPGAVIGAGVRIAAGHTVPRAARATLIPYEEGMGASRHKRLGAGAAGNTPAVVGPAGSGGIGRLWPAEGELDKDDDDEDEEEDEDEENDGEGEDDVPPFTLASADSALERVSQALAAYSAAQSAAAHADVGAAARSALALPTLSGCAGLPELAAAVALIATAPLPAAGAGAKSKAAAGSAAGGAGSSSAGGGPSSSASAPSAASASAKGAAGGGIAAFVRGVTSIMLAEGTPDASSPSTVATLALEVKSFKHAENRSFADCMRALVPIVLGLAPGGAKPTIGGLKATLSAWAPLLLRFRPGGTGDPDAEYAVVAAVASFVCAGSPEKRAAWMPLFGVAVNLLYDAEITSSAAVSMWAEDAGEAADGEDGEGEAEEGEWPPLAAADNKALLATPYFKMLMDRIDAEDDDDEDEEEEDEK
jgi:UDP-3-O-[3-hydroxymyristoyl] glucosamine N-acyltransferase